MNLLKLMAVFLLFCAVAFAQTLSERYPNLSKSDIEHYKKQKEIMPKIEKLHYSFDSLSEDEKSELKKMVDGLVPQNRYGDLSWENKGAVEFLLLFATLMNNQAYIIIDKFSDDREGFFIALITARLLKESFPTNVAFYDTFLWGEVKRGKFDLPLKEYPKLLKASNNDPEIQKHYEHLLELVAFNPKQTIEKIKEHIQNRYYTHREYDQAKLFEELQSITANEKEEFIELVNKTLHKHIQNEISIYKPNKEPQQKQNQFLWEKKGTTLYIKPTITSGVYQKLKEVLENNSYEKIVLDFKGNEGGVISGVVDIVNAFISAHTIVTMKNKFDTTNFKTIPAYTIDQTTPLKVLVDEKTARGALYIAAILQKHQRATISGKASNIDNSVFSVYPLRDIEDEMVLIKIQTAYSYDADGNEFEILSATGGK